MDISIAATSAIENDMRSHEFEMAESPSGENVAELIIGDGPKETNSEPNAENLDTPPRLQESDEYELASDGDYDEQGQKEDSAFGKTGDGAESPSFECDLGALLGEFPELASKLAQGFVNTERYAKLRALGLTPEEAYLATSRRQSQNNRSHLTSSVPASAKSPLSGMSQREMSEARSLFGDLSEREIKALYNRVTKQQNTLFY